MRVIQLIEQCRLVFIRQLKRPIRDKIVLAVLMGCGLVATGAGIAKMVYTQKMGHDDDFIYVGVRLGIFSYDDRSGFLALSANSSIALSSPSSESLHAALLA
jgi:hypothetical protein